MGRDQESAQFEWVNAWAEAGKESNKQTGKETGNPEPVERVPPTGEAAAPPVIARVAPAMPDDQLMRDIAEIERARDALAALPLSGSFAARRTQALTLVAARTSDPVPVMVGGVLALVMLTVFGAAAAMTKLAR